MTVKKFTNVVGVISIKELGEGFMPESNPPLTDPNILFSGEVFKEWKVLPLHLRYW